MGVSEHPVLLQLSDDLERDRLTVFFRVILAIPHFIWIALWGSSRFSPLLANWLATLALGRSPEALHHFLAAYVKYVTQVYAYFHLAADPYPTFDRPGRLSGRLEHRRAVAQSRWTVALRGLLFLPALLRRRRARRCAQLQLELRPRQRLATR